MPLSLPQPHPYRLLPFVSQDADVQAHGGASNDGQGHGPPGAAPATALDVPRELQQNAVPKQGSTHDVEPQGSTHDVEPATAESCQPDTTTVEPVNSEAGASAMALDDDKVDLEPGTMELDDADRVWLTDGGEVSTTISTGTQCNPDDNAVDSDGDEDEAGPGWSPVMQDRLNDVRSCLQDRKTTAGRKRSEQEHDARSVVKAQP